MKRFDRGECIGCDRPLRSVRVVTDQSMHRCPFCGEWNARLPVSDWSI